MNLNTYLMRAHADGCRFWMRKANLTVPEADKPMVEGLKLVPPEDRPWSRVKGLSGDTPSGSKEYRKALKELAPDAGSYILMSLRRRKK